MKKLLFVLSLIVVCFGLANLNPKTVSATSYEAKELVSTQVEELSDGSYIVSELYEYPVNKNARSNYYDKTGQRIVTKYSASDNVLWVYTLIGYFTVNEGNFCTCYSCEYTTEINSSSWSFSNGSSHYVGNVAYGEGTFTYKLLFITMQTVNIDIHVQCDEYGVIS